MRVGNVFGRFCLSVCLSICLSVCPSVQAITFEPLHIETSFLVCRYIFTISRSSLSIKVIGQGQGHMTGFPPIREIRENLKDFSQSGKSGKNRGFSAKIREKIFKSGNFFFRTIFKPFNLRKKNVF